MRSSTSSLTADQCRRAAAAAQRGTARRRVAAAACDEAARRGRARRPAAVVVARPPVVPSGVGRVVGRAARLRGIGRDPTPRASRATTTTCQRSTATGWWRLAPRRSTAGSSFGGCALPGCGSARPNVGPTTPRSAERSPADDRRRHGQRGGSASRSRGHHATSSLRMNHSTSSQPWVSAISHSSSQRSPSPGRAS